MRKCRNWQTSKTKDLVSIALVWVQVPSSAFNRNSWQSRVSAFFMSGCIYIEVIRDESIGWLLIVERKEKD